MRKTIIILLFLSLAVNAQDMYDLFGRFLNENGKSAVSKEAFEKQLNKDASITPALIYLRIWYYNSAGLKDYDSLASLINRKIKNVTVDALVKKSFYVNAYLDTINELQHVLENQKEIYSYFEKQKIVLKDRLISAEYPEGYDKNLDNFFRCVFYTQDDEIEFNKEIDYLPLLDSVLKQKQNEINDVISGFINNRKYEYTDVVDAIVSNFYLSAKIPPVEKIFAPFVEVEVTRSIPNPFSFQIGFQTYLNSTANFALTKSLPDDLEYGDKTLIDLKKKDYKSYFFASFRFNNVFDEEKKAFQFFSITLGLGFSKSSFNYNEYKTTTFYEKNLVNPAIDEYSYDYVKVDFLNAEIKRSLFFSLTVTAPLMYFADNIFLEGGISVKCNYYTYSFDYNVLVRNFYETPYKITAKITKDMKVRGEKKNGIEAAILPVIAVRSLFFNSLIFEAGYNINNLYLSTGYLFN